MSAALSPVGMLGLGNMGGAMAANLLKKGHKVMGYDPLESAKQAFTQAGGQFAEVEEIAKQCPVIFLSLPSVKALEANLAMIVPVAKPGTILVELSTLPVEDKLRLHDSLNGTGLIFLDAPLSGTGAQAKTGDLVVMLSGDEEACNKIVPVLKDFARRYDYLGEFGNGMKMKIAANLLVTIHNVAAAEGLLLATRLGLSAQQAWEVLIDGAGGSRMLQVRGPQMVAETFVPPTMTNKLYMKDVGLILDSVRTNGLCSPLFEAAVEVCKEAAEQYPEEDTAAAYSVLKNKMTQ